MIFTQIEARQNGYTHIDGYSKAKTIKGAIKDLAKEIEKVNTIEANTIIDNIEDTISILNITNEGYFIECELVSCASRFINEEQSEVEYKEANYYLHICFAS
jgi:hypothetical protein